MTTARRTEHAPLDRLLVQVERQVSRRMEAVLTDDGLTVDQWRVLDLLADGAGRTMSAIAAAVAVPGPTLTKVVDRLVDAAAVYRLADVRDRRRVLVFLSDDGRATHERLAPLVRGIAADVLTVLGADGPALLTLLGRLTAER
ncbi:MAG: MarR family transcriptional regulator [Pseudonocardia sp.]|nr:MarR family transcriptional regulator [Pseudonocardia sp.]